MPHVVKSTIIDAPTDRVWDGPARFQRPRPLAPRGRDQRHRARAKLGPIGCVRRFKLADGSELREQLLALSDLEQTFSYCLLDTPIPIFNYVAHVRLLPVTDGDRTFWHWESRFTTRPGEEKRLAQMVGEEIYQAGFEAIREHLREAV
jgi:hypothetical protein